MRHIIIKVNNSPFAVSEQVADAIFNRPTLISDDGSIEIVGVGKFLNFPISPKAAVDMIHNKDPRYIEALFNLPEFPIMDIVKLPYEGMAHISELRQLVKEGIVKDQKTFNEHISPIK